MEGPNPRFCQNPEPKWGKFKEGIKPIPLANRRKNNLCLTFKVPPN